MRQTTILFYIFLCLTLFLLAIHVKRTVYFEYPSKAQTEQVYSGQAIITTHMTAHDSGYIFNFSLHHIRTEIVIKNFDIELIKFGMGVNSALNLDKVLPYNGMHNWDIPEFKSFEKIPDTLRALNSFNNPYYAYDFVFKDDAINLGDKFIANISADFTENGKENHLVKEILIFRKSKLEIRPLDAHSDGSFLLIPITGLITIILFLGKIFVIIRQRQRSIRMRDLI